MPDRKKRKIRRGEYTHRLQMTALNDAVLTLFLSTPPTKALLLPTILQPRGTGGPEERVLATCVHIPAEHRDRISTKPYVRTTCSVIRQDGIPVMVALTKLGDYPPVATFSDARETHSDPTGQGRRVVDILIEQRQQRAIVWAGAEQIRNISSESDPQFWVAIRDALATQPPYTSEAFANARDKLEARSTAAGLWAYTERNIDKHF